MKVLLFVIFSVVFSDVYASTLVNDDVSHTLDEMVKNNVISSMEAKRAKIRFKSVHKEFLKVTNRLPASINTQVIETNPVQDLSKVQVKQIEKDVYNILGRSRFK